MRKFSSHSCGPLSIPIDRMILPHWNMQSGDWVAGGDPCLIVNNFTRLMLRQVKYIF
jgi:hypothetical protein